MSIPRFQGLPRKLNINSPDGRAYCDQLRESNNVAIQIFLDGVEQTDVVAYDQDRGVVEVSISGPLGMHANPEVRRGRVTLSLKTVEKKPAFNPYGWLYGHTFTPGATVTWTVWDSAGVERTFTATVN